MNARAPLALTLWLLVVGSGCVKRLPDAYRDAFTARVAEGEGLLAAKKYLEAQGRAESTYAEMRRNALDRQLNLAELAEGEPELWKRLNALDAALEALYENAPSHVVELAKQGDAGSIKALAAFVYGRHPMDKLSHASWRERQQAFERGLPAALEAALSRSHAEAARAVAEAAPTYVRFRAFAFTVLAEKPGCERAGKSLSDARGEDIPAALTQLLVARASECAAELEKSPTSNDPKLVSAARLTRDELAKHGVAAGVEPRASVDRLVAALDQRLAEEKAAADAAKTSAEAERERRLAPIRAELEKAAARKDLPRACALSKENDLPLPDSLRGAELAGLATWEAHRKQARSTEWPASAWLHTLWLRASGEPFNGAPAAAEAWAKPLTSGNLDWRSFVASEDCFPYESRSPEKGAWRVIGVRCSPSAGQLVTSDVYETQHLRVARLRWDGKVEVLEKTIQKKVGEESVRLNSTRALVTMTVEAPLAHEKLLLRVMGSVPNQQTQVEQGFLFVLSGAAKGDHPAYDLRGALTNRYLAEVDALKAEWKARALARGTPEDEREEAFARVVLLDPKSPQPEALAYFRERYKLEGAEVTSLRLAPPPKPCP